MLSMVITFIYMKLFSLNTDFASQHCYIGVAGASVTSIDIDGCSYFLAHAYDAH